MWGGISMTLKGRYFLKTDIHKVRFALLRRNSESEWSLDLNDDTTSAEVDGKWVDEQTVQCLTPKMKDEGPVLIQISLNGVEYSKLNEHSHCIMWRKWYNRVQVIKRSALQDGGGRIAWKRFKELQHELNFYSGHAHKKVISTKITQKHLEKSKRLFILLLNNTQYC